MRACSFVKQNGTVRSHFVGTFVASAFCIETLSKHVLFDIFVIALTWEENKEEREHSK